MEYSPLCPAQISNPQKYKYNKIVGFFFCFVTIFYAAIDNQNFSKKLFVLSIWHFPGKNNLLRNMHWIRIGYTYIVKGELLMVSKIHDFSLTLYIATITHLKILKCYS